MEEKTYYLGLDMGTNSVGWAVTDPNYQLLRAKGKDLWGIREFDEAEVAVNRRMKRTSRRNHQRKLFRLGMLKDYFEDEIAKVDPNFLVRLKNSKYYAEDKDEMLEHDVNGIFNDPNYKDKDYFNDYPTISHLRSELIHNKEPHDVRLVYLALLNMYKHRGHFLSAGLSSDENMRKMEEVYKDFADKVTELLGISFPLEKEIAPRMEAILGRNDSSKTVKKEMMLELLNFDKSRKKENEIVKAICGLKVNACNIFEDIITEDGKKIEICFADFGYEDKIPELEEDLGEDNYQLVEVMKEIYDKGIFAGIMQGEQYLSDARIKSYEKHKKDLRLLKDIVKEYGSREQYNDLFRADVKSSYSAYVNSYNSQKKKPVPDKQENDEKRRRGFSERKVEDFYKNVEKILKTYVARPEDDRIQKIIEEIKNEDFMPKQMSASNGVIPNQAHLMEMKVILKNAEEYLPFLKEKDESGLTVSQRIIELYKFQIPYYIGPTSLDSVGKGKTGWVERKPGKERAKVYPWNFEDIIDTKKSSEKFIERMVRRCTYIEDKCVLPKASLMYERFKVLNEINNLRIQNERISVPLKQELFETVFERGKKVSRKNIFDFLHARGLVEENTDISGIDVNINNALSSYGKFKAVFGEDMKKDNYKDMAEDIIFWCTVYGDSKKFLEEQLMEKYPDVFRDDKIRKRIMGFKFKDWGNLSREFLELEGCKKETGESTTLLRELWESPYNLMELLHSEDYTFGENLKAYEKKALNSVQEIAAEDLDDYYFSAPVKRMVWQTILVIRELENVLGCAPKKIFVEMTRKEDKDKKRTVSRKQQLLDLYKNIKDESRDWKQIIEDADNSGNLRSKKMYLYLTQMGRCMYSGETIELQDLFNDNLYDIDHIYPRHFVKDDNLSNNLVLVKKELNNHKSDTYPLEAEIRRKQHSLWKGLLEKKLINEEKYRRLTGANKFSEEQQADFIARQLVETSQGTKGVADLLKMLLPETTLVYSKAGNVSDFRKKYELYKSRTVNDFHHAHDAYLNIVVGNVYHVKFTSNPLNYIKKEYRKDSKNGEYNLGRMFDWNVERNGEVAWIGSPVERKNKTSVPAVLDLEKPENAEEKNVESKEDIKEKGTIVMVKKMLAKNTPLLTRYCFDGHGEIANATLYNHRDVKDTGYIPLKVSDAKLADIHKYGGLTSISTSYFFLVEHEEKKKRIRTLETVPVYLKEKLQNNVDALLDYCKKELKLKDPVIKVSHIRMQSCVKVNGYYLHLSGKTLNRIIVRNAVPLCFHQNWVNYIKKIEKTLEKNAIEDAICEECNRKLYELLLQKHNGGIFTKKPNPMGKLLFDGKEKFEALGLMEQCKVIMQILNLTIIGLTSADLKEIGGAAKSGVMLISKNITSYQEFKLIHQSVTGLFEKEVDLLNI